MTSVDLWNMAIRPRAIVAGCEMWVLLWQNMSCIWESLTQNITYKYILVSWHHYALMCLIYLTILYCSILQKILLICRERVSERKYCCQNLHTHNKPITSALKEMSQRIHRLRICLAQVALPDTSHPILLGLGPALRLSQTLAHLHPWAI